MIPKIIHYCWLSNDPVPNDLQKCMESWRVILPDYEFIKWDFSRFDINSSAWVKSAFENRKYAFAADYIRLYALYHYGGFYLDMDVQVLKTFNPLLSLPTVLGWQNMKKGLEVAAFGAEKGSLWLKDCLDYYNNREFKQADGNFDIKTLPLIVQDELEEKGYYLIEVDSVDTAYSINYSNKDIPVFPEDYFSPKSYDSGKINVTDRTYSIHHFSGSWLPTHYKFYKLFCDVTGIKNTGIIVKLKKIFFFFS